MSAADKPSKPAHICSVFSPVICEVITVGVSIPQISGKVPASGEVRRIPKVRKFIEGRWWEGCLIRMSCSTSKLLTELALMQHD